MGRWGIVSLVPFIYVIMFASLSSCGSEVYQSTSPTRNGNIITAASCSYTAVNAAYNDAFAGDTIRIPSGSCTWSNSITIAKANLVISGAGASNTVITRNNSPVFQFAGTSGSGSRITGIGFIDCSACVKFSSSNAAKDWRIDNNTFTDTLAIQTLGTSRGLVDNNTFSNSYAFYLFANGNSSVTYPLDVGDAMTSTTNTIFIEDNLFTDVTNSDCPPHSLVGNLAARAIIRYNTFDYSGSTCWDALDAHDSNENYPDRGTLGYEIYENKFYFNSGAARTIHVRGGQHMIYNNYFNVNMGNPIRLVSYTFQARPERCTGNPYDTEDALGTSCPDQINHTYAYGNKESCSGDMDTCSGGSDFDPEINQTAVNLLNTHIYFSTLSGYTGYTYPHPLR